MIDARFVAWTIKINNTLLWFTSAHRSDTYVLWIVNLWTFCAQKSWRDHQKKYRPIGCKILFVFTVCLIIPTIFIAEQFHMSSHLPVSSLVVISACYLCFRSCLLGFVVPEATMIPMPARTIPSAMRSMSQRKNHGSLIWNGQRIQQCVCSPRFTFKCVT